MALDDDGARVEQRLDALARANRLRAARASLKRRIASGEVSCADLLLRPTWEMQSMPVAALLASQRYWGKYRCRQFLRSIQLSEVKSIGAMTERQRLTAVAALRSSTSLRSTGSTQTPNIRQPSSWDLWRQDTSRRRCRPATRSSTSPAGETQPPPRPAR